MGGQEQVTRTGGQEAGDREVVELAAGSQGDRNPMLSPVFHIGSVTLVNLLVIPDGVFVLLQLHVALGASENWGMRRPFKRSEEQSGDQLKGQATNQNTRDQLGTATTI